MLGWKQKKSRWEARAKGSGHFRSPVYSITHGPGGFFAHVDYLTGSFLAGDKLHDHIGAGGRPVDSDDPSRRFSSFNDAADAAEAYHMWRNSKKPSGQRRWDPEVERCRADNTRTVILPDGTKRVLSRGRFVDCGRQIYAQKQYREQGGFHGDDYNMVVSGKWVPPEERASRMQPVPIKALLFGRVPAHVSTEELVEQRAPARSWLQQLLPFGPRRPAQSAEERRTEAELLVDVHNEAADLAALGFKKRYRGPLPGSGLPPFGGSAPRQVPGRRPVRLGRANRLSTRDAQRKQAGEVAKMARHLASQGAMDPDHANQLIQRINKKWNFRVPVVSRHAVRGRRNSPTELEFFGDEMGNWVAQAGPNWTFQIKPGAHGEWKVIWDGVPKEIARCVQRGTRSRVYEDLDDAIENVRLIFNCLMEAFQGSLH